MVLSLRKTLCCSLMGISTAECPCTKIGENDFGGVRMGNEHADQSGLTKFYAHIDTPIGNEQQEDYAFLLKFSEPVTGFVQHFANDNAEDGSDSLIITPNQNRISGDPYTFNVDGLVENGDVMIDAWYCKTSTKIEMTSAECFGSLDSSDGAEIKEETNSGFLPDWECDTYGRCVVKYDTNMAINEAREACKSHKGMLPLPRNEKENDELSVIGSTWLELMVNEKIDMTYENFRARHRAFLNAADGGKWDILHGTEVLPFFCVEKVEDGCPNIFRSDISGNDLFNQGDGEWRIDTDSGYRNFEQTDGDDYEESFRFQLGTTFQYRCPNKLKLYKPWRKSSKEIIIKCVKMTNGDMNFAECNNKKCKLFNRYPWWSGPVKKSFSVGGIGAASTRSQIYC